MVPHEHMNWSACLVNCMYELCAESPTQYLLVPLSRFICHCFYRIISSPRATGFNNFFNNNNQKSVTLNLEEGEDYLLVGEFKEGGGQDYLRVYTKLWQYALV